MTRLHCVGSTKEALQSSMKAFRSSKKALECALELNKERSSKLIKSSQYRGRFPEFSKHGFEKETALLIPTTPCLKAMEGNCGTISDQNLCIQSVNLLGTSSNNSFRLTVRNILKSPVCK